MQLRLRVCSQRSRSNAAWVERARCPHRSRDTPQVHPCRLGGGIHAATRSRKRRGRRTRKVAGRFVESHAHRPSRLVLARPPSRDLTRHGCRVRAYKDVLAACPAMVGGQGPCSQATDQPLCLAACPAMVGGQGPRSQATDQPLCLAACPAMVGGQGPRSQATDQPLCLAACPAMVGGQGSRSQAADQPACSRLA
ncbi:hypothetical protein LMG31884_31120 [Xanthomonas hydrangeae]|nr:hypothetical protein LMG31884_31120 [Xanthomonas hydrangeae]CAD7719922.1 hypothetical protein LMG31884_31120 [Xanthomonas hydrangeae]CAD7737173.1 hypothetical protein LMG31887_31020 [Xanthomonas hydrangeae]CAD7737176.1 hypothetical protein LMG31887_31020 [Xanthomonas hydrangeae]